jgi:hypothetical protein
MPQGHDGQWMQLTANSCTSEAIGRPTKDMKSPRQCSGEAVTPRKGKRAKAKPKYQSKKDIDR